MADLSREELASCRAALVEQREAQMAYAAAPDAIADDAARRLEMAHLAVETHAEVHFVALLDMAERSVSTETVRALAVAMAAQSDPEGDALQCWSEFHNGAAYDLRPAAARLDEGKGE